MRGRRKPSGGTVYEWVEEDGDGAGGVKINCSTEINELK